jgi:hypothetical protein
VSADYDYPLINYRISSQEWRRLLIDFSTGLEEISIIEAVTNVS